MNNQEVSTAYVGSTEIKEARLGTQLVLAPGGDALWYKANEIPTLDLRFADNKSLVDATTGTNLIDFTRASSGTYVDSQGVIRNAVTNLLVRSEEFDNASWTLSGILAFGSGSIANAATAPNGTLTAEKIVESSGGTTHLAAQQATIPSGTVYTLSVYAKAAERTRVALYFGGAGGAAQGIIVDLTNGTFAANIVAAPTSYSITPAGNGWYRISITATSVGTVATHAVYICNDSNAFSYSGDGTSGIYLWGAQLEQSSTVGEYIPTTSSINSAPRFDHDPTTGESLGLLVEESRANLLLRSEEFDNASWTKTATTVSATNGAAPNGTATADTLIEDTSTGAHSFSQSYSFTSGTTYAWSIYVKAAGRTGIRMQAGNQTTFPADVRFNLSNGTVATTAAGTGSITALPDGWYRCTVVATAGATASTGLFHYLVSGTVISYTGDGASGLLVWGAQLEAGAFPTSYIKNVDTPLGVTRLPDIAQISGSNFSSWYRQDEGTILADVYREYAVPVNYFPHVFDARNTGDDLIQIAYNTETIGTGYARTSAVDQAVLFPTNVNGVRRRSQAFAYKTNDFAISANGGPLLTDGSGATSNVINQATIGGRTGSPSFQLNGTIRRFAYWGQRLPNSVLQAITQ